MPKLFDRPDTEISKGKIRRVNEDLWFKEQQQMLLWMANTEYGRELLAIPKDFPYIHRIAKNEITHYKGFIDGRHRYLSDFRIGAKWGNVIRFRWSTFQEYARYYYDFVYKGMVFQPVTWYAKQTVRYDVLTAYPDPNPETSTVDGMVYYAHPTYSTAHDAATGTGAYPSLAFEYCFHGKNGANYQMNRGFFLFDTSSISPNTVDSATLDINSNGRSKLDVDNDQMVIVSSSPASNTDLTTADYDQIGLADTAYDSIDITSWDNTASNYNQFTLSAGGIANIDTSGISKFGLTTQDDLDSTVPTGNNGVDVHFADETGTSDDPKLTVTHSAASTFTPQVIMF